jgi:hypothetical protein
MEKSVFRDADDRRSGGERRRVKDPGYNGPERRARKERRVQGGSRSSVDCDAALADFLRIS